MTDKPKIIIESPFAGATPAIHRTNIAYVRAALRDSLLRGEVPMASHAIYALPGVLDDTNNDERTIGMEAGFAWHDCVNGIAVYTDRGMSRGMEEGIARAEAMNLPVEMRSLPEWTKEATPTPRQRQTIPPAAAALTVASAGIVTVAIRATFIAHQAMKLLTRKGRKHG